MKASGICGSDLKMYRAPKGTSLASYGFKDAGQPIIAGHEPCGVVAAVGRAVTPTLAKVGDRVMVHHYYGCTACSHCRTGWTQMCVAMPTVYGVSAHGGHAKYLRVPASTLVPLPDQISFAAGAAIACGTGTAYQALVRLDLSARDTIAIFGQGPVGQSATQLASAMGAEVISVDVSGERARRALELGATHAIDASQNDPVAAILEITKGKGASRALDATGVAAGRSSAIQCAGSWGVVCFVGEGGDVSINVSPEMLRKQLTILGSWTFSTKGQADCANFIAGRGVDVDRLVTDKWTLDQAAEAYVEIDRQAGGKAVFLL
jgi:threonine dehydrogenase-like Zn-dependent dehydrogenase